MLSSLPWLLGGAALAEARWEPGVGLGSAYIPGPRVWGFAGMFHARRDGQRVGLRATPMAVAAVGPGFWCLGGLTLLEGRAHWSTSVSSSIGVGGGYLATRYEDGSRGDTPRLSLVVTPVLVGLGGEHAVEVAPYLMINTWPSEPLIPMAFLGVSWFPIRPSARDVRR